MRHILLALVVLFASSHAWAWGDEGHKVICEIAFRLVATGLPDRVVRFSATHPSAFYAIAWLVALEIAVRFDAVQAFFSDAARLARALLSLDVLALKAKS
jgi:hypothetical protein